MKLKKIVSILVIASLILVISACGTSSNPTAGKSKSPKQEEIVLKFGHVLAPDHPYQLAAEKFKEILEANAPQKVKVELYPNAQLGSERDLTEGLQLGTIDIAIAPGTISSFEPRMKVLDLPYIFKDKAQAYRVLDGEIGKELASGLPAKDLRLLAYWENGFRHITNSKKPIVTPADLEGIKIRVPENSTYVDTFKQWNASVTTMAFGELYGALQQKTIDGQENPLALISTNKFYEAQKYLSLTGHFYGPAQVLMSEITWKKLSKDMQAAVQKAAEEARDYERQLLADKEDEYLQGLKDKGMVVNEVDKEAFIKASKPVWDKYNKEFGDLIEKIQNEK